MGRYLHLFETEGEFSPARGNDYIEPWVSLTVKGTGDVKSFIGEFENGLEQQFNYFGSYGDDYVNTDIIESDITAIDGENQTITVDGYAFSFENSQDNKYMYSYQGESQTTGTVERTWIEELQIGEQTQQISACTVNGTTFGMIQFDGEQYYWIEVDFATVSIGSKSFIVDHELQVNESVTITGRLELNGYTSVEPAVGVLFKYINYTNSTVEFVSENGKHVQAGDTYNNIIVKSIVEAEEGETINRINYNKTEEEIKFSTPLTFEITSGGTIYWMANGRGLVLGKTIQYKLNDGEWTPITSDTGSPSPSITVAAGDTVQFCGNNSQYGTSFQNYNTFSGSTAQFKIKGNIMSLIKGTNFGTLTTLKSDYTFNYLFGNCTGLTDASELLLPATTLARGCYINMFNDCTSLTIAPQLPATTLAVDCYNSMFYGCTSLTTAPELPATTLEGSCYSSMFSDCTSLTIAPELPATTLAANCYDNMFWGCTSLTIAPQLPATTLAISCYNYMFDGCTSLTTAPQLPATTLAVHCYYAMFSGCTSLTAAPELPATTLETECYRYMFQGCTSLTTAPSLPATTLAGSCYNNMFNDCTSLTTAPELPATILASNCYNYMFDGCTSLTTAPSLPATTLTSACYYGMFNDCTSLTTAPQLPATKLASSCYGSMFQGCTSLTTAPELPATSITQSCYNSMFYGCTSLTTAPELPATSLTRWCYENMFYGCTSLTTAPELPATSLPQQCYMNMFNGCTNLNYIKCLATDISASSCTSNWVNGVANTGIFVKAASMTYWSTGTSGIPNGWTVQDAA